MSKKDQTLKALIAGCERCGSTWLANLFEAHPDVALLMEPFAPYAGLFSDFPVRHKALDLAPSLEKLDLDFLLQQKYPPFLRWDLGGAQRRQRENIITSFIKRFGPLASRINHFWLRYHLLNLHQQSLPLERIPLKTLRPNSFIVKEFRLNHCLDWFKKVAPDSKLIILARHPLSQVGSMKRMMAQGSLGELRFSLGQFFLSEKTNPKVRVPESILSLTESKLENQLALYWWLNYQQLVPQAKKAFLDWRLIGYEKFCQNPEQNLYDIFTWLKICPDDAVFNHLKWSISGDSDPHDPVGTRRGHKHSQPSAPLGIRTKQKPGDQALVSFLRQLHQWRPLAPEFQTLWRQRPWETPS